MIPPKKPKVNIILSKNDKNFSINENPPPSEGPRGKRGARFVYILFLDTL
jgi:hypothetical protein